MYADEWIETSRLLHTPEDVVEDERPEANERLHVPEDANEGEQPEERTHQLIPRTIPRRVAAADEYPIKKVLRLSKPPTDKDSGHHLERTADCTRGCTQGLPKRLYPT